MVMLAGLEIAIRTIPAFAVMAGYKNILFSNWAWIAQYSPLGFWCSWSLGAYIADGFLKGEETPLSKVSPYFWLLVAISSNFFFLLQDCQFLLFSFATAIMLARMLRGAISFQSAPEFMRKFLRTSGEWSYSLYLLHLPFMVYLFFHFAGLFGWVSLEFYEKLLRPPDSNHYNLLRFAIGLSTLPVIYGISTFFYRFVERPGIALRKKFSTKPHRAV